MKYGQSEESIYMKAELYKWKGFKNEMWRRNCAIAFRISFIYLYILLSKCRYFLLAIILLDSMLVLVKSSLCIVFHIFTSICWSFFMVINIACFHHLSMRNMPCMVACFNFAIFVCFMKMFNEKCIL